MADYFTSDHFKLLNKWRGQRKDTSNPEQQRAYDDLKEAYGVTAAWAEAVKNNHFPLGRVEVLKKPTNQASNFVSYNWARIYPSANSPKELAYTVGIDADHGFVVKIDTVGVGPDQSLRQAYMKARGLDDKASPIVAMLAADQGLKMSMAELVEWSIASIRGFGLRYEDIVDKLEIRPSLNEEDLLSHFDGKQEFKTFRASWSSEYKTLFCRLARAVNAAGLDWWHVDHDVQVRFGRKNPGKERAAGVLAVIRGTRNRTISWVQPLGEIPKLNRQPLTDELVSTIEAALGSERAALDQWFPLDVERPGLWPDGVRDEPLDPVDESGEEMVPEIATPRQAFNRIYYGPPGTGKTFKLGELLKREYEQEKSAVSKEEWQRQFVAQRIANLKWWEGIAAALHELGGQAKVSQISDHVFIRAIVATKGRSQNVNQTIWASLQSHTIDDSATVKNKQRQSPAVFDKSADSTWHFAGEWREACADLLDLVQHYQAGPGSTDSVKRYSFVTFHQSYGYEEFVEGLRPVLNDESDSGDVRYEIRAGVFKELCREARLAPSERFAMVVDEINRGNISKIFGELITLIEPDKREGAKNAISVTLPYSGESFSVPANVDIIGSMNTADRSLALLDTALRRRFDFEAVLSDARDAEGAPLHKLRVKAGDQAIDIPRMLAAINQRIEALYDRDHCIGHAYFTPLLAITDEEGRFVELTRIFRNRILPLLEEYFFEDWQKIRLVLADNQKAEPACFVAEKQGHEADMTRLFGGNHGLDSYGTKRRYAVQEGAFSRPDAYIGIYQTLPD
jgi:5-methylcytosine-specific restriction protein B